jgi:hypothetical protein
MSKSIYAEAIADAKKVREAAEANAKNAILESVTPKIREFIEQTILAQEEPSLEQEEEPKTSSKIIDAEDDAEHVSLDESAIGALLGLLGGENILDEIDTKSTKKAMGSLVNEAIDNLSSEEKEKLFSIADKLERNADILESNVINNHVSLKENNDMAKETFYEVDLNSLKRAVMNESASHDSLSEKDLNELMSMLEQPEEVEVEAELGADIPLPQDLFGDEEVAVEDDVEVEETDLPPSIETALDDLEGAIAAVLGGADDALEDAEGEIEDAEADLAGGEEVEEEEVEVGELEEVYEIDPKMLKRELRKIRRELREGKGDMEQAWGGKGHANAGTKNSYGGKGSGKVGAKRSFGGGTEGQDPFVNPPQMNKLSEALRRQVRLNRDLSEKLGKYRGAVKSLREQLEDLNLFNAKLLYVNKLLQNKGLTESQRKSVIRALDKAETLSEAKTLYNSLTESFSSRGKSLNESRSRGSSSRATTSAASKTGGAELNRWAKLAGLK